MRSLALLVGMTLVSFSFAQDEKKDEKKNPANGTWTRKAGDFDLTLTFKKEKKDTTLKISLLNGENGAIIDNEAKFEKDGVVKCKITKFEKKGDFKVEKEPGFEFSFKVKVEKKKMTLSDMEGKDIDDAGKAIFEGEYDKKPKEKN
jgi:hypothetical protein